MKKYLSIDVGGTAIKYGIVDENGNISEKYTKPTESEKGGKQVLSNVVGIADELFKTNEISGICISTAGMVDTEKGEIFFAGPSMPDYTGTKYKAVLEEKFGVPCEVENDVNCAGLAEYISGAAKGAEISLMLTIGTGIGGSAVIDGNIYHGFSGSGVEIGYMRMNGDSFQNLGSARALVNKVAALKNEDSKEWNGMKIFDAARNGDSECILAIDEMVEVLGIGIANICCVLNPQTVVLGGGIMAEEEYLKPKIERAIKKNLVEGIACKTTLAFAKHRNNAGMLGAFYNFKSKHN